MLYLRAYACGIYQLILQQRSRYNLGLNATLWLVGWFRQWHHCFQNMLCHWLSRQLKGQWYWLKCFDLSSHSGSTLTNSGPRNRVCRWSFVSGWKWPSFVWLNMWVYTFICVMYFWQFNSTWLGLKYVIQKTFCEAKHEMASEPKFSDLPLGGKTDGPPCIKLSWQLYRSNFQILRFTG